MFFLLIIINMEKEPLLIPVNIEEEEEIEKQEIEKICKDTSFIRSIMYDLNSMIYDQSQPLETVEELTEKSKDILRDANLRSDIEGYRDVCRLPLRCSVLLSPLLLNCSPLLIRLVLDDVDGSLVAEISWKISI